mmetsp:Transcript_32184/g.68510  ORF Transcript_32184/g.68510 Transcript_32184/m.68510 type:complete len:267 (-) Transcript_32184:204-1004(-)
MLFGTLGCFRTLRLTPLETNLTGFFIDVTRPPITSRLMFFFFLFWTCCIPFLDDAFFLFLEMERERCSLLAFLSLLAGGALFEVLGVGAPSAGVLPLALVLDGAAVLVTPTFIWRYFLSLFRRVITGDLDLDARRAGEGLYRSSSAVLARPKPLPLDLDACWARDEGLSGESVWVPLLDLDACWARDNGLKVALVAICGESVWVPLPAVAMPRGLGERWLACMLAENGSSSAEAYSPLSMLTSALCADALSDFEKESFCLPGETDC